MTEEEVHDVTLENGQVIEDVPVSYTVSQIHELALNNNLITPEELDFVPNPSTWADSLPMIGEMGAGIAAGTYGVAQGAATGGAMGLPYGPYAAAGGAILGGIVGGASAAGIAGGTGNFLGSGIESLIEGSTFDPEAAISHAVHAAKTDALFSAGGSVALPALAATGKVIKEWVSTLPSADKGIEAVIELQKELRKRGASLLPQMITDTRGARISSSIAKVSEISKQTIDRYFKTYSDYMGEQASKLVQSFKGGTAYDQGQGVRTLIETTDKALTDVVTPFYQSLSVAGKIPVSDARPAFSELARDIRTEFRAQRWDEKTKKWKEFTNLSLAGDGVSRLLKELDGIPSNLSFAEAHKKLSTLKTKLRDAESVTNAVDTKYIGFLKRGVSSLQKSMDDAAEKLSPELYTEYKKFSTMYREGKTAITTDYLDRVMRLDDPAKVGAMLTQDGLSVGLKDIKALVLKAKEYRNQLASDSALIQKIDDLPDPLEGIRRGYIESIMGVEGVKGTEGIVALRRKLTDPKFRDTFNVLFEGTALPKKVDKLLEELSILEKGAAGSDSAFSLTVKGSEVGAAKGLADPTGWSGITSNIINLIPGFLANRKIKPESVDQLINLVKSANAYAAAGKELPKGWWVAFQNVTKGSKVSKVSSAAGVAVGSQFPEQQPTQ